MIVKRQTNLLCCSLLFHSHCNVASQNKNLTNAGQWGKASAFRYKWLTFKSQIILPPEWPPTIVDFVIDNPPPPLHHLCLSWLLASFHLVSFAQSIPKKMCLIRIALAVSERLRLSNGASREFVTWYVNAAFIHSASYHIFSKLSKY